MVTVIWVVALAVLWSGCSEELGPCPVIYDSTNSQNELRLIPNSHDKSYSAILVCGPSNPVLVARFAQCLPGTDDRAKTFFAFCDSSAVVTPKPAAGVAASTVTAKKPTVGPATAAVPTTTTGAPPIPQTEDQTIPAGTTTEAVHVEPAAPRRRAATH
jgi:hypothetical protein